MVGFDPGLMLELIETERPWFVAGVPTMLIAMMDHPEREARDLSSLRHVLSGGSQVPEALVRRIETTLGVDFTIVYGQTECSPAITNTLPTDAPADKGLTIGPPLPHIEVAVVDPVTFDTVPVGAPGELSKTEQVFGYFRALAKATPRVRVETIGKSEEGRDILLVAIADEEGIRDLAKLKAATAALADPRKTTPEEAERIIESARPIYYFNAGLHSSETGSPEMVMELAYRIAVSDQPMIQAIRHNVILLINPVSEPDGRDRFVEWFYRYLKGRTDYENLPPMSPPYWGHYVYHDNNRDTHQKALETTRAVHRMFYDYHPTVVHDLHESIALLQTWNGTGPWNPNLDPIVISEFMEMSFEEVRATTAFGMPGVWTWAFGEGFGHHYMESVATNHNAIGRGYETFGNATATARWARRR
jgi:hypothetical protein